MSELQSIKIKNQRQWLWKFKNSTKYEMSWIIIMVSSIPDAVVDYVTNKNQKKVQTIGKRDLWIY